MAYFLLEGVTHSSSSHGARFRQSRKAVDVSRVLSAVIVDGVGQQTTDSAHYRIGTCGGAVEISSIIILCNQISDKSSIGLCLYK